MGGGPSPVPSLKTKFRLESKGGKEGGMNVRSRSRRTPSSSMAAGPRFEPPVWAADEPRRGAAASGASLGLVWRPPARLARAGGGPAGPAGQDEVAASGGTPPARACAPLVKFVVGGQPSPGQLLHARLRWETQARVLNPASAAAGCVGLCSKIGTF